MELLLILGALAVLIIVAVGALVFLQQRRSGTIRAVTPPRRGRPAGDAGRHDDGSAAA